MKRKLIIAVMAGSLSLLAACSTQKGTAADPKDTASAVTEATPTAAKAASADAEMVSADKGSASADTESASANGKTESAMNGTDSEEAYHKISAEEAKKMMDEGGVTIVDVRTSEEYREKHIPDAILVPNESITTEEAPAELPDKDAVLLIHCRTGVRSKQASDKLVELGYKHVYDFGGIVDWPYETVSEVVGGG